MNFTVYLIRNRSKDIVYVGITRQCIVKRFKQHCWDKNLASKDFTVETHTDNLLQHEAAILEKMLILQYDTVRNGLNKAYGSADGNSVYHRQETKEYLRSINVGKKVSPEHAAKNRTARLGQKNSPEHQAKIVAKRSKPVVCLETGVVYKSAREAARGLDLSYCRISEVCNGKRTTTGGMHFTFLKVQDKLPGINRGVSVKAKA